MSGFYFSHPESRYFAVGKLGADQVANYAQRKGWSLAEAERRHIQFVLRSVGGNKTQACKILQIGRATLYSKLGEVEPK